MSELWRIVRLLRPYWRYMAQALLVGLLTAILSLPGPYITKVLLDDVYPGRDFDLLYFALGSGAVLAVFSGLIQALSSHFGQYVGIGMSFDLQSRFYRHIQGLDFSFFDGRETGEILARFDDMQASVGSTIAMVNALVMNGLHLLIFPAVLFYIDWRLALLSLAVLPFDTLLVSATGRWYRRLARRIAERSAALSAKTYESLASIRTVQALGVEADFYDRLCLLFERVARLQVRASLLQNSSGFAGAVFKAAGSLAYGWYGWTQVLKGELSVGVYMAFTGYVGYLYGPLENLIGLWPQLEVTLVHARRFFEVYELQAQVRERPELPALSKARGQVGFHGVCFSYGAAPVLCGVDLEIAAGSTVALVGRSGAGKSTLVKLIPRFYDPDEGWVSIDGRDVRQYRLRSLRRQVGFAMQGSALFQGTILENLTFGRDIPRREVEAAARAAHIHDFVASLPRGYEAEVGEQGVGLSEGQKQRLALARVLLLDAPILILDEPTAALDAEAEAHVQAALERVSQGRTTLIIAHRLATIRNAEEIVVLDAGRVAERGRHELLLAQGGLYARLNERMASI